MIKKPTYEVLEQRVKELEKIACEQIRAERALQESEERYRLLFKNLPGIVYKGYKDWSAEFFDNKIERLTGYDVDEFNSRDFQLTQKNVKYCGPNPSPKYAGARKWETKGFHILESA